MEWSNDLLEKITRMAAAAYTHKQIAFALGIPKENFTTWMQDAQHPASVAFYTGLFSSELAVRESAFLLARSGSSPAQTLAIKLFDETRKTLLKDGLEET